MAAYSHAKDFVPEVDAPYPVGLLYYQLGVCYGNNFDYPLGLFYMEKALECYELAGKERLQYIVKAAIGQSYLNLNRFEEAETILNEVLEFCNENEVACLFIPKDEKMFDVQLEQMDVTRLRKLDERIQSEIKKKSKVIL